MNDDELITKVMESLAQARMTTTLDSVVQRGRARRNRRRLTGLTGAAVVVGGSLLAVSLLAGGSGPAPARLTAWTVARQPGQHRGRHHPRTA